MKATLRLKLHIAKDVEPVLLETLRQSTDCFNSVCRYGWDHDERNGVRLHQSTYTLLRIEHPALPSQLVISARMKATESLKSAQELKKQGRKVTCPQSEFCPIRYDARSYWVKLDDGIASLATVCGRATVQFRVPDCYQLYLTWRVCSADLCYDRRKHCFYLHVVVDRDAPDVAPCGRVVGCDLGVKRVAVTSTPKFYSSKKMHTRARQHRHLKSALQAKGTKSAKRHLKKASRRWTRFQACHNHLIANSILDSLSPGDTLALEDLTGIRDGCKQRKKQRGLFHRWSFAQLRLFLSYKAERKGVTIALVDPAYSSQTCHKCGHCEKANRKSQSLFVCKNCGNRTNADYNAAQNLRQRGISFLSRLLSDSQSQPTASLPLSLSPLERTLTEEAERNQQRAASPQALAVGI